MKPTGAGRPVRHRGRLRSRYQLRYRRIGWQDVCTLHGSVHATAESRSLTRRMHLAGITGSQRGLPALDRRSIPSLRRIEISSTGLVPDVGGDLLRIARRAVEARRRWDCLGAPALGLVKTIEVLEHVGGVKTLILGAMPNDVRFELRSAAIRLFGELALGLTPQIQSVLDSFSTTDHARTAFVSSRRSRTSAQLAASA